MIYKIYSKRIKEEMQKEDDVYNYTEIPNSLRFQLIYLLNDFIGDSDAWDAIRSILIREYGIERLVDRYIYGAKEECHEFIKKVESVEKFLDMIELGMSSLEYYINENGFDYCKSRYNISISPENAVKELNHRFKENNLGYEYIDGKIIRIDRKFTHNEIVKPALKLLYEEEFEAANEEFITAHIKYREGCAKGSVEDYKNAIINCNKAFESTMKIICERKKELVPTYNNKHTANELINDLIQAKIIPNHLENSFHGLKNALKGIKASLENGLPVIRNRVGHGNGINIEVVNEELVTYAINMAATNIVLLVNIYKTL